METRYQKITAYFACLFVNPYTRAACMLNVLGIISLLTDWRIIGIVTLIFSFLIFLLTGFGYNSYDFCKRAYNHMVTYEQFVKIETPCAAAGNHIAMKRLIKFHPEKYYAMCDKKLNQMFFAVITIAVSEDRKKVQ